MLKNTPDWFATARCKGLPPEHINELFYPTDKDSIGQYGMDGVVYCQGCQHRVACLEFALECGEKDGTWGGVRADRRIRWMARGWYAETMIEVEDREVNAKMLLRQVMDAKKAAAPKDDRPLTLFDCMEA